MKKILVVDDELDVGELLKDYLEMAGYHALLARDAEAAFRLLEAERPDLVMLDIVMPKVDGLEVLRRIKQTYPETIVVMMSGLQNEEIAREAIRQGAYDYLTKPFDFYYLQNNILGRIFSA